MLWITAIVHLILKVVLGLEMMRVSNIHFYCTNFEVMVIHHKIYCGDYLCTYIVYCCDQKEKRIHVRKKRTLFPVSKQSE